MSFARITLRSLSRARPTFAVSKQSAYRLHRANFSAAASLTKDDIQGRVFEVLKSFEKVDHTKVGFVVCAGSPSIHMLSSSRLRLPLPKIFL